MSFAAPQALLLLVPLLLFWWKAAKLPGWPGWLRAALLVAVVLAIARPQVHLDEGGSDVVVIVDRSRSMPPGTTGNATELVRLLAGQRQPGDRLGVVAFGRESRVEQPLSSDLPFGGFQASVDAEASNLAGALDAASDLVPQGRSGRVLVLSDGRATGQDVRAAARRLAARGIPVDYRWLGREDVSLDVAVSSVEGPPSVAVKEPFQLSAVLKASAPTQATVTLTRAGKPLVKTERQLAAGPNVLTFRDLVEKPGLVGYEVHVEAQGDGVVENDTGRSVVRVEGPPRVLLLTDKANGTLATTLASANLNVEVRAPFALSMESLENVGAVVLEDVEAGRLSESGLRVLAQYVKEAGGGLVMTGGRHSFGEGGYRKSPVEDVLPVTLEIREEQRKAAVALSIIMDCSCSMGATVPDGRTKMELAAEGVVGALQLLNPRDEAAVHMVDTEDHEIFGMSPVSDGLPLGKVARGFSGGGGIYVGVGLRTAKKEILRSTKPTRHVLLFSDAADSENPDDYQRVIGDLTGQGVTVSVIGLGGPGDPDADLLREVAARGNGRMYFAEDATSLPRIFSQETIAVARATFVDTPTATRLGPDLPLLGKLGAEAPEVGGYNLTYLRGQASLGLRTEDENKAPVVAMWPRGAGKVVALPVEVDGEFTGKLRQWPGLRALLVQATRWVMPAQVGAMEAVARAELKGNDLHVTLDFDPNAPPPAGAPTLVLLSGDGNGDPVELPMRWEDEERVGAHFTLPGSGTWHPVVKLGDRVYRAPPVTLPWAPEFEPAPAGEGQQLLEAMAAAGNGVERLSMTGLYSEAGKSESLLALAPFLIALAVALLVSEVVVRRFFAGPRVKKVTVATAVRVRASAPRMTVVAPASARPAKAQAPPSEKVEAPAPEAPPPEPAKPTMRSALDAARERAKKRTGR